MKPRVLPAAAAAMALLGVCTLGASPAQAEPTVNDAPARFATLDAGISRGLGQLTTDLRDPQDRQASAVAEILQTTRADVVVLNNFDYVADNAAIDLFRRNFLAVPHGAAQPIDYPYAFAAPGNDGIPSGFDLNRNGVLAESADAWGRGDYPGQHGVVVLSKYPIDTTSVRTFHNFRWADMPGAELPDSPSTSAGDDWYSANVLRSFPLSSTSHWDVPILIGQRPVHALVSNPDNASGRAGQQRHHDEIRFWNDYISPGQDGYIYDDAGVHGGIDPATPFVVLGDLNGDPHDGFDPQTGTPQSGGSSAGVPEAVAQLLDNKRLVDPLPASEGAPEAAALQGGANSRQSSDPAYDTVDLPDNAGPGNLRTDYVLPSRKGLLFTRSGVFWPIASDPLSRLIAQNPSASSNHRLVWVDLRVQP